MKFSYFKFPLSVKSDFFGDFIYKPIIPIELKFKNNSINYLALIDSGADLSIIDAEAGEYLGIDVKNGKEEYFGGVQEAGLAVAYLHDVQIGIGDFRKKVTVGFSYDIAEHGYGIFGQKGFFDLFIVKFDFLKTEIELKPRFFD